MKFAWDLDMEKYLLELVLAARGGPSGKGLKKKAWHSIDDAMKARYDRDMQGKCQSKYQRLMAQYKTYRFTSNLSGAGVEPGTNRVLLDANVWSDLIQTADANTQCTYRQLQKTDFAHADVCALLAGDAVATGEEGGSIGDFDAGALDQGTEPAAAPEMPVAASTSVASSTTDGELPASHQQRTKKLKRLRD
ncbi:hypothetical protein PR002_g21066, partial [Phytophthora rubi]